MQTHVPIRKINRMDSSSGEYIYIIDKGANWWPLDAPSIFLDPVFVHWPWVFTLSRVFGQFLLYPFARRHCHRRSAAPFYIFLLTGPFHILQCNKNIFPHAEICMYKCQRPALLGKKMRAWNSPCGLSQWQCNHWPLRVHILPYCNSQSN
jgi:hypothetical protein